MTTDQIEKALVYRREGKLYTEIGVLLGEPAVNVRRALAALRVATTNEALDVADEYFNLHIERLEALWATVSSTINALLGFDDRVFKVALAVLERQAKLLGLDRGSGGRNPTPRPSRDKDWLSEATPSELIAEIESYGLEVPKRFKENPDGPLAERDAVVTPSGAA